MDPPDSGPFPFPDDAIPAKGGELVSNIVMQILGNAFALFTKSVLELSILLPRAVFNTGPNHENQVNNYNNQYQHRQLSKYFPTGGATVKQEGKEARIQCTPSSEYSN